MVDKRWSEIPERPQLTHGKHLTVNGSQTIRPYVYLQKKWDNAGVLSNIGHRRGLVVCTIVLVKDYEVCVC